MTRVALVSIRIKKPSVTRVAKNLGKIRTDAEFPTGERNREHTELSQLVKYGENSRVS